MTLFNSRGTIGVTIWLLVLQKIHANIVQDMYAAVFQGRFCVEHEIQDCQAISEPLQNFTDILLPTAGCTAVESQHRYLYVHICDCDMVPMKEIHRPHRVLHSRVTAAI